MIQDRAVSFQLLVGGRMDDSMAQQKAQAAERAFRSALDALKMIGADSDATIIIRLNRSSAEGCIAAAKVAWDQCIFIERFPFTIQSSPK